MQEIPIRYANPTKFDIAQYGVLVKVLRDDGSFDYFIQISKDEEAVEWIEMSKFLDQLFKDNYENDTFIKKLLKFKDNNKDIIKIIETLHNK